MRPADISDASGSNVIRWPSAGNGGPWPIERAPATSIRPIILRRAPEPGFGYLTYILETTSEPIRLSVANISTSLSLAKSP